MRRQIPSLSALETFEAVARHGSATRAAEELGRTQSAVSRQILNLEAFERRPLFDRSHSRLVLNEAGRYLFEAISRALDRLEHAVARTATLGLDQRRLALRVWPTLGARWLMSRLAQAPVELGIDIDLSISVDANDDLDSIGVDAAILYGSGEWPDLVAYRLIDEELVVVAQPRAVDRLGTDVSAHPWLYMEARPGCWRRWAQARTDPGTPLKEGPQYAISLLIEMACLGQGAAALPRFYVERELANGQLVAPFGEPLLTGRGYYLCYTTENARKPDFVAFKDWLLGTC
jgi:DNA-binding transcriptional LysR family regulator